MKRVLFIGATGVVGSQVVPLLAREFELSPAAFGGGRVEQLEVAHCDITDFEATQALLRSAPFEAVVNCAVADHRGARFDDPEARRTYFERCLDINARGAYYVFEAAARAGVPACVFVSSLTAVMGEPRYSHVPADAPPRPRDLYSCTKLFGEQLGATYAHRAHDPLRVLCLRLGQPYPAFVESDENWNQNAFSRSMMVHHEDIAAAITRALHSSRRYGVYPILSRSDGAWIDQSRCQEIDYAPQWTFSADGSLTRAGEGGVSRE